jgi:acetyl esterase/lipase
MPMPTSTVLLLASLLLATLSTAHAAPERLALWPQGAPLAQGQQEQDQPFIDLYPAPAPPATQGQPGPAFLVCPGGGYGGLALQHEGADVAAYLNSLGISAYVLHYRLGSKGYHYPVQLIDVQRGIRLVRSKAAEWKLDPQRLGIIGFSAGGHLTSMAATLFDDKPAGMTHDPVDALSARPDLAVPVYPVISMADSFSHSGSRKNLLGPASPDDQLATQLSTQKRVTPQTPPCFLFQTDADTVVPAENAVSFYLALRAAKVPAELHIFQPGKHGVGLAPKDPVLSAWPGLLKTWLSGKGFLTHAQ